MHNIVHLLQSGHQILTHIKMVNCLKLEVLKAWKDLQAKVDRLLKKKVIEIEGL